VSLYKPESAEAGHRPTLLISNAAKGDAARLGYIPPPPKPVSEFGPLPPEYNYSRPYPGYRPGNSYYRTDHHYTIPYRGSHKRTACIHATAKLPCSFALIANPPRSSIRDNPLATPFRGYSTDVNVNLTSSTVKSNVPNRVRGKVHVICKEDGIEFSATTLFPFTGQIFANERKRVSSCVYNLVDSVRPMVFLPFADCGVKNAGDQKDNRAQYHMQVVMVIQQNDGTSTVQSFMAQCVHQKIHYNKQTLPRRIEEALEELRLVATKLEQKAPLPQVEMKIVVDEHHQIGPEWKLIPESDAYGFHVKNCIVRDDISGIEHKMIDELGCSTDLSIFAHPHYDTYHDTASSHLWAFKVPDHTRLRIPAILSGSDHFAYKFNSLRCRRCIL
ncbi:hypothetical protein V3C99_006461, partial [Haemonchus contortus]